MEACNSLLITVISGYARRSSLGNIAAAGSRPFIGREPASRLGPCLLASSGAWCCGLGVVGDGDGGFGSADGLGGDGSGVPQRAPHRPAAQPVLPRGSGEQRLEQLPRNSERETALKLPAAA